MCTSKMLLQFHERYPFAARAYSTVSKRQDFDLDSSILPKIWLATERHGCRALQAVKFHDDVIKWKHFPRYWPFMWGIHRSPVNSPHKRQWRGAMMFSLICAWINGWVNNRTARDLRRHRTHCDVIVMINENHYIGDIWAIRCLKSQAFRLFYQQFCQLTTMRRIHVIDGAAHFINQSISELWIPLTRGQQCGKYVNAMTA